MSFSTHFARALMPVAMIGAAVPATAAESPDMAKVRAHLGNVQSMTANFVQTDARGRSAAGTLQLMRSSFVNILGEPWLLFDIGGAAAIGGLLVAFAVSALRNGIALYREERLPRS